VPSTLQARRLPLFLYMAGKRLPPMRWIAEMTFSWQHVTVLTYEITNV
jgi:hypothetical protein